MKHSYMCNFGLQSPFPNVPLSNAPAGAGALVRGSQLGALVGGGMGLEKTLTDVQAANMHLSRKMNMAQFAIPTRVTSLANTQAPLSYARRLGMGIGAVKGATEGSNNITIDPETGVGTTGVGLGERLYKVGTNALGGYIAGDVGGRLYNNRAALLSAIKQHKDNAMSRLPTVNIQYN